MNINKSIPLENKQNGRYLQFIIFINQTLSIILLYNTVHRSMEGERQKFTKNYIDCIIKNQNYIMPTKSCELGSTSQRTKKYLSTNNNQDNPPKMKFQLINLGRVNKIFQPVWQAQHNKDNVIRNSQNQKLIDIFIKKNQQIAASLMKQKKSMSDYVYSLGPDKKGYRYSEDSNNKSIVNLQLKNRLSYSKSKAPNMFPKINVKPPSNNERKSLEQQQTQIVIIRDHKLANQIKTVTTQQPVAFQPVYSEITNVNIKKFLKLKQHAYEKDEKIGIDQLSMKKKKIQNHKKRLGKKQKQYIKNSLQEYLQAKLVPREHKFQSLRSSCKNQELEAKKQTEPAKQEKQQPPKDQQTKSVEEKQPENQLVVVKNPQSLQKSRRKIGLNAKISNKNIFGNMDSQATIYEQKIRTYRQFLFILNAAHNIFDPLIISDQQMKNENKYKYFVGRGNNRQLVKALMKRRFWWIETEDINQAQFVWTQLKVNSIYEKQTKNGRIAADFYQAEEQPKKKQKPLDKGKKLTLYKAELPENSILKIMTHHEYKLYSNYLKLLESSTVNHERYQVYQNRRKFLPHLLINTTQPKSFKVHNHLEFNYYIGNKKALYYNLKKYCELTKKDLFNIVPLTFHVGQNGVNDQSYKQFLKHFKANQNRKDCKNVWIVKPGQNSNRGNGISVFDELYEINKIINSGKKDIEKGPHTFIIQKYIEKPLLYKGRKFDIRHYMLATRLHGKMRLYFYGQGYVRTSSSDFDLSEIGDNQIHLTNDAIQKHADNYGKFEEGNKVSYSQLQRYFDVTYPNRKYSLSRQFYPKIKQIALETFKSCYLTMDPQNLSHNFQIFGLDFMIDSNFNVWLIEVNTNPCLQLSSNLLSRIIPTMLEHSFRLAIDPLFPPTCHYINSIKHLVPDNPLQRLQYELIFDEARDGRQIQALYKNQTNYLKNVEEDEDTFDNDGKQIEVQIQ